MLTLLSESYFKGKDVSDFIEYERNKLLVACPGESEFYLVNRDGGRITPIASLNQNYITLGMQMMPGYETSFALVRDTRGIQLLDLKTLKSNQLFLSECNASFLDTRMLQILFDPKSQKYTVVTYHDEKVLEESGESILKVEEPQLRIFTMPYEFTLGLKTML